MSKLDETIQGLQFDADGLVPAPSEVIPEPAGLTLLAVGGVLVALRRRR